MNVRALKSFYLKAGQRVEAGEIFEASDEAAAQLVLRKSVEYAKGTYETKVVVETPVEQAAEEVVEGFAEEAPKAIKRKGK